MLNLKQLVREAKNRKVFDSFEKNILLESVLKHKIIPGFLKRKEKNIDSFIETINSEIYSAGITVNNEEDKTTILEVLNFLLNKAKENKKIEFNEEETFNLIKAYKEEYPEKTAMDVEEHFKTDERLDNFILHKTIRKIF